MDLASVYRKIETNHQLNFEDALFLYKEAPLSEIMLYADMIRYQHRSEKIVSWIIDRNINITNVCISGCRFCNFYCKPKASEAYITSIDEYKSKIQELIELGGNQILLQGGLNPDLGLKFYSELFQELKDLFPEIKLHALGPPEIIFISKKEKRSVEYVLKSLVNSGLDSLPGAGAEILSDRVRKVISPGKCSVAEWLDVMRVAHKLGLVTSATMMFGHIETFEERIEHLFLINDLQQTRPADSTGFISFTPWPFQSENTILQNKYHINNRINMTDYIRLIAISRIIIRDISHIQASWLTVGFETAKVCLHAGADDMGSIMIEENVVSSAGAGYKASQKKMEKEIQDAGFIPKQRNQNYDLFD